MPDIMDIPGQTTLHANEYAAKHGISRRTVTRYIQEGRIQAIRRKGRTFVVDQAPSETPIEPDTAARVSKPDTQPGQLARPTEDYLIKLGQLSIQAKTGHRWKILAIILILGAFVAAPVAAWLYFTWQDTADDLAISQQATADITADLSDATATIKQLQADVLTLTADAAAAKTIKQSLEEALATEQNRTTELQTQITELSILFSQLGNASPPDTSQGTQ